MFCQFCGTKLTSDSSKHGSKTSSKKKADEPKPAKKTEVDLLWDKFVEVYDAKEDDRKRFNELSSPYIWELQERLSTNAFEAFLQDNKEELNKQPYTTIEALKTVYTWAVIGGYRLWLAEALLDKKEELNKFKPFSLDKFVDTWKVYDFDKAVKALSDAMGICITRYNEFRFNGFIEAAPQAKELSNETIEKLKSSLLFQVLNGYHAGKIENSFRK